MQVPVTHDISALPAAASRPLPSSEGQVESEALCSAFMALDQLFWEDGGSSSVVKADAADAPDDHGDLHLSDMSLEIGPSRMQSLTVFDCYATGLRGQYRRQRTQTGAPSGLPPIQSRRAALVYQRLESRQRFLSRCCRVWPGSTSGAAGTSPASGSSSTAQLGYHPISHALTAGQDVGLALVPRNNHHTHPVSAPEQLRRPRRYGRCG